VGYTPELSTAVWVGHPDSRSSLGYNAFGGTLAAPIWQDYMSVAKGDFCGDFPAPEEPVDYQPFFGTYAGGGGDTSTGTTDSTGTYTTPSTTTPTAPTTPPTDTGGYDPGLYAPGAGQAPAPSPDGN
jgi:membrane carboxypeptidase/penicillin-binding protein